MKVPDTIFQSPHLSLSDLLGKHYIDSVCEAKAFVEGCTKKPFVQIAEEKVDFYPEQMQQRCEELLKYIGKKVCDGFMKSALGAPTKSFKDATNRNAAPLNGFGFTRIGEDGRLYLCSKSEHYHASLGHHFPGYALIEKAVKIGISNTTHNNARGHICRLLEQELISAANGFEQNDPELNGVIESKSPHVLNKVINLQTGSLAAEAGIKMMLTRFYKLDDTFPDPDFHGRIPVFLVMGDNNGGLSANYHGTTVLIQLMRDLWPQVLKKATEAEIFKVVPIRINDFSNFKETVDDLDHGKYKIAGFLHELILMNYGGIKLDEDFVKKAHALCNERNIPTLVDEIQTCLWSPQLFLFREYKIKPDLVSIGKGFPGGQYPASRILLSTPMDNLNQFGALVTSGQEELSSLSYLITIKFARINGRSIKKIVFHL